LWAAEGGAAGDAALGYEALEEQDGTGRTLATFVPSGRPGGVDETLCVQRDLAGSGLLENQANTAPAEPVCGSPVSAAAVVLQEFWLHADDQFSTTSVTDSNGGVVERYDDHDDGFPMIRDADGVPSGANAQGMYASNVGNARLFTGRECGTPRASYTTTARADNPGLGSRSRRHFGRGHRSGHADVGVAYHRLCWLDPIFVHV
jgi:hypothetical protein